MLIIGLNHGEINSSAALLRDGRLLAGAPEERFNRTKWTRVFPEKALSYCLQAGAVDFEDVDYVAQSWNPGCAWQKYNALYSGQRIRREENFYSIPDHLFHFTERRAPDYVTMEFPRGEQSRGFSQKFPRIHHISHHLCHAANAYYLSPFEHAAYLTCDFRGEFESGTHGVGEGKKIRQLGAMEMPHSLGMLYSAFTELVGYRPDNDEWKVMALAAFDVDCRRELEKIQSTYRLCDDGFLELDQSYYKGALLDQPKLYTRKLVDLLGGKEGRQHEDAATPDEWTIKVARAMQLASEEIAFHMLNVLHRKTKNDKVVLGGGFFMNSVLNGKVLDRTGFKDVSISYAPADAGNSIGAALYAAHHIHDEERSFGANSSMIGPEFSEDEMVACLRRRGISYQRAGPIEEKVAELLSQGEIVAVMSGRMEFGERALGNRSILADPRQGGMRDKLNAAIKYREGYRPFAPSVLCEKVAEYFEVPPHFTCSHMEKVVRVREEFRRILPAVTHVDGSGRVQTVDQETNPRFYKIIEAFERMTGLPLVLNTSFNINGEPIVCTPDDALTTFYNSGLSYLALGSLLVKK